ncbi:hypothetical protein [Escherichia coli]|uniref:hypothetical protein n=1 Tax=Escherichia coli TaxID=562 RepID=UPI0039E0E344
MTTFSSFCSILPFCRILLTSAQLTKTIRLNIPIYTFRSNGYRNGSAPGYCSGSKAVSGFIHKNMSIERQAEEVRRVKNTNLVW